MNTFLDLDPIEEHFGVAVTNMNDSDLYKYAELYHLMTFEHSLKDDYGMANSRIKWLRRYFDRQAGEIVKWVWFRYDGIRDGQKFTFSWFTDRQMWFARRLQSEMAGYKVHVLKEMALPVDGSRTFTAAGFMTGNALASMTTSQIVAGGVPHPSTVTREQIPH